LYYSMWHYNCLWTLKGSCFINYIYTNNSMWISNRTRRKRAKYQTAEFLVKCQFHNH